MQRQAWFSIVIATVAVIAGASCLKSQDVACADRPDEGVCTCFFGTDGPSGSETKTCPPPPAANFGFLCGADRAWPDKSAVCECARYGCLLITGTDYEDCVCGRLIEPSLYTGSVQFPDRCPAETICCSRPGRCECSSGGLAPTQCAANETEVTSCDVAGSMADDKAPNDVAVPRCDTAEPGGMGGS